MSGTTTNDELLAKTITHLNLGVRARKALARMNVHYIDELVAKSEGDIMAQRDAGVTTLREIRHKLAAVGLSLRGDSPKRQNATATVRPATAEFIKINNWIMRIGSISRMNIKDAMEGDGDLTPDEILAVWSYLTDPSRCVDLTPGETTATSKREERGELIMPYVPTFTEIMNLVDKIADIGDLDSPEPMRSFGDAVIEWVTETGLIKSDEAAVACKASQSTAGDDDDADPEDD